MSLDPKKRSKLADKLLIQCFRESEDELPSPETIDPAIFNPSDRALARIANDEPTPGVTTIGELDDDDLTLVQQDQDVESIKHYLGKIAQEFDGFFVKVEDGDYSEIWGFNGTVPYLDKTVYRLLPDPEEDEEIGDDPVGYDDDMTGQHNPGRDDRDDDV